MTKEQKRVVKSLKKEGRKHILKGLGWNVLALGPVVISLAVFTTSVILGFQYVEDAKRNRKNIDNIMSEVRESDDFKLAKESDKIALENLSNGSANYAYFLDFDKLESDEYVENYMKNNKPETYEKYQNEIKEEKSNTNKEHASIGFGLLATVVTFCGAIGTEDLLEKKGKPTAWDRIDNACDHYLDAKICFEKAKKAKKEELVKE